VRGELAGSDETQNVQPTGERGRRTTSEIKKRAQLQSTRHDSSATTSAQELATKMKKQRTTGRREAAHHFSDKKQCAAGKLDCKQFQSPEQLTTATKNSIPPEEEKSDGSPSLCTKELIACISASRADHRKKGQRHYSAEGKTYHTQ
jgi:hypothetical protein